MQSFLKDKELLVIYNKWNNMKYLNIIKSLIALGVSAFFSLVFFSYDLEDPSFDRATNLQPKNLAGNIGAYIADPLMQLFGYGVYVLILVPLCWAYVYFRNERVSYKPLRIIASLIALVSLSLLLNDGAVASLALLKLKFYADILLIKSVIGGVFLLSLFYAMALSMSFYYRALRAVFWVISKFLSNFYKMLPSFKARSEEDPQMFEIKEYVPSPIINKADIVEKSTPIKVKKSIKPQESVFTTSEGFTLPSTNL